MHFGPNNGTVELPVTDMTTKDQNITFNRRCCNRWNSPCRRINFDSYLTPCSKINSEKVTDITELNC